MSAQRPSQVVVIGAGIVGLSTAYYLAQAGLEVAVLERRANVAEEASFGSSGLISPGCVMPPATPEMAKAFMSSLFRSESAVILKPKMDRALWRWLRLWLDECEIERYQANAARLQRLARYSQQLLLNIEELHQPEFEQSEGAMRLFRTFQEFKDAQAVSEMLAAENITARLIEADAVRALEPGISADTPLAGALYLPNDMSGNCALFARQLKHLTQALGVQFHFSSSVDALEPNAEGVGIRIGNQQFTVDAVVVAAGRGSSDLLAPLRIHPPVELVKGYAATVPLKDFDAAPQGSVLDPTYQVAISRIGTRVRLAGVIEPGVYGNELHKKAIRTLIKVGSDWFPGAANYNTAHFWAGLRPVTPNGAPLIGPTSVPHLYVNTGHGAAAWSLAAGSGKIVADIVARNAPEIDLNGLVLQHQA